MHQLREQYDDSSHQRQTICCTIRELMANNNPNGQSYLRQDILTFLDHVLGIFDEGNAAGSESGYNSHYNSLSNKQSESLNHHRSRDARHAPEREYAELQPWQVFQAAHQNLYNLPQNPPLKRKRPQSSRAAQSTKYSAGGRPIGSFQGQPASRFDVAQDLEHAKPRDLIYENSGRLSGPAGRGYTGTVNSGINSVQFIHELKSEAANDQRHALRAPKPHLPPYSSKPVQPAAFRAASGGAGGPRGQGPIGLQYSLSANYSNGANPISRLNNAKNREAAAQAQHQAQPHQAIGNF